MNVIVPIEKSFGQLLYDLGFKNLCEGKKGYSVADLDLKIIDNNLSKNKLPCFRICANKKDWAGRNYLANPGFFIPPDTYYFFKEARYKPDKKTFLIVLYEIKGYAKKINGRIKMHKGSRKVLTVEQIRSLIGNQAFERYYRAII